MQLALPSAGQAPKGGLRLPPCVPPFNTLTYRLFTAVWMVAFALALVGPLAGLYERYSEPGNNSQLLLGSRAGFAVSPRDATIVRFTVGPQVGRAQACVPGDHIVAIYGLTCRRPCRSTSERSPSTRTIPPISRSATCLFGTDSADVPLTVRDPDGQVRDITVTTGDNHIDDGARALGMSPKWLNFIDLLHVLAYPFLLWAAWMLHHRNSRDAVSSILSLAVLLTMAAEQPASMFLTAVHVPRWLNVAMFDLGNVLLLTGILLFPHGNISWRRVGLDRLAADFDVPSGHALPDLLRLLHDHRRPVLAADAAADRIGRAAAADPLGAVRDQRLCGAALRSRSSAIISNGRRTASASSCWSRSAPGISFALAVLVLQVGLLIALVRYRLYDAEFVISRSANVALITLAVAAVFAGHGGRPKADHLQLFRQHQQRRADHLRRGAVDGPGQPDPGARSALVGTPVPEKPLPAARRFARGRARHARDGVAWRNARRNPRARRPRRARGAELGDRQRLRAARARAYRPTRLRHGAPPGSRRIIRATFASRPTSCSRSGCRWSRARTMKSRSAIFSSARGRTDRSPAATSKRRFARSRNRSRARSAR